MKLFQHFQKVLSFLIVRATAQKPSETVKIQPLRMKNWLPHISFAVGLICTFVFLLFEAKKFVEYSETFYPFATLLANLTNVCFLHWNGPKLFKSFENLEEAIDKRNILSFDPSLFEISNENYKFSIKICQIYIANVIK